MLIKPYNIAPFKKRNNYVSRKKQRPGIIFLIPNPKGIFRKEGDENGFIRFFYYPSGLNKMQGNTKK